MDNKLIKLFIEAVSISSPSGQEAEMAKWVCDQMIKLNWKTWIDQSGSQNDSNSGNVYAYLEVDSKFQTLVFSAHLDTVQSVDDLIIPQFEQETFKSNGQAILGADNKSGVSSLIMAAQNLDKNKLNHNILFFFPTREEAGVMGSSLFKFDKDVKFVFNVDSSDTPGIFIYKSLGYINFEINVLGLSAHAAKDYEAGKNSILIASELITSLPLGRDLKEGWTFNIGQINGGKSTNVVCELVNLKGEIRAYDQSTMNKIAGLVQQKCDAVAKKHQIKIDFILDKSSLVPAFNGQTSGPIIEAVTQACQQNGLKAEFKSSFSTSDANNFSGQGYSVLSVSRGGKNAHSVQETLSLKDLKNAVAIVHSLIYQ